jgi:hypothetical protein
MPAQSIADAGTCWIIVAAEGCGFVEDLNACTRPHPCGVIWAGRPLGYVCSGEVAPPGVHRGFSCALQSMPVVHSCEGLRLLAAGRQTVEGEAVQP